MRWLRKLRLFLRQGTLDTELAKELQHHLDLLTERNREAGMNPQEARFMALRQFGNVAGIEEEVREVRGWGWLEQAGQDLRLALRQLRRNLGFTTVAALTLALGIGANSALFSVINAVLLKALPVAEPSSLVFFSHEGESSPAERAQHTNFPLYEFLRDRSASFSGVLAFSPVHLRVRRDAETEGVSAQWVTLNYFSVLGVTPVLGRAWTAGDETQPTVVVISQRFWQSHFGADPAIVGKTLSVSGQPVTVVGVAPPEFLGLVPGAPIDLTFLLAAQPVLRPEQGNLQALGTGPGEPAPTWPLFIMGRRKAGVSLAQAGAETTVVLRQWAADRRLPDSLVRTSFHHAELSPGGQGLDGLRQRFARPLWMLMSIVGFVFLIACANIANLLLARTAARRHEIAVRVAIGASRGRLIRQLLTESLTLTSLGGLAGLLLGWWGSSLLAAFIATGRTPVELDVGLDWRVLAFTLALAMLAGLGAGLAPAWRGTTAAALKEAGGRGRRRWGLGPTLVAAQLALSLCLLVGTGLFTTNLRRISGIDPGFQTENLLSVSFDWAGAGYTRAQMMAYAQRALEQVKSLPGVQSAATTHIEPLGEQQSQRWFSVHGPAAGATNTSVVEFNVISADYFRTLNLPLAQGRDFDSRDGADAPKVAIISEALARSCFGESDPIGQPAWIARDTTGTPFTIIGVAKDSRQRDLHVAPLRLLYVPATQSSAWEMNLVVRTAGDPRVFATDLRRALAAAGSDVAVREITTAQTQRERGLLQERLLATLSGFFGPLALLLAAIGLYGLLAYDVSRRTHEIGVRMALGAQPASVLGLVLKQGMRLVAVGVVVGLVAAGALARLIQSFLFAVSPGDPATLLLAAAALVLAALLACWLPARRAAKVNPMNALHAE